jgi:hypothetical protein
VDVKKFIFAIFFFVDRLRDASFAASGEWANKPKR